MPQNKPFTSKPAINAEHHLTQEDITRLLNPEQGAQARLDVTGKLAGQYTSAAITSEQQMLIEQVFRLLVRDTELDIRKKLSDHLKSSDQLPRDIALTMANDVVEVALPILEYSTVLTDLDLADLIESTPDTNRHVAVAKRQNLAESVVVSLLENSAEVQVASTLADNHSAHISPESIEVMIQRHQSLPDVMDRLVQRPTLSPSVREKIISRVSADLTSVMSQQYQVATDVVQKEASQTREQATLELINDNLSNEEMQLLVEQMISFDRLTPELLFAATIRGYVNFYVMSMAILAEIPVENAHKLMCDYSGLGFRGLYNKTKLNPLHHNVLRDITPFAIALKEEKAGLEGPVFGQILLKKISQQFQAQNKPYEHLAKAVTVSLGEH